MHIPTVMDAQNYRRPFAPKAGDSATNYSPAVTAARPDAHYPAKRRAPHRDQQRVDLEHLPTLMETHVHRNPIRHMGHITVKAPRGALPNKEHNFAPFSKRIELARTYAQMVVIWGIRSR